MGWEGGNDDDDDDDDDNCKKKLSLMAKHHSKRCARVCLGERRKENRTDQRKRDGRETGPAARGCGISP